MEEALRRRGIKAISLSSEQKAQFDQDGFLNLGQVLAASEAAAIVGRLRSLAREEGDRAGSDGFAEAGTMSLGALENKDPLFDILYLHPLLLAAVAFIMGMDFGLSSLTSRAALPGEGGQPLHWDSSEPVTVNALWVLTEFTAANGATRIVPGSHKFGKKPEEMLPDLYAPHPEERLFVAPAGTLAVFHGRLWHSGTQNRTNTPRHMASAYFMRRGRYQAGNVQRVLSLETQQRLDDTALYILDHSTT